MEVRSYNYRQFFIIVCYQAQCCEILLPVWRYYHGIEFSWVQTIGAISFPISFISLLSGTILWHFHVKEVIRENLSIVQKIKVAPFFLCIVVAKVWVMADLCNTLSCIAKENAHYSLLLDVAKLLLFLTAISIQVVLHLGMRFSLKVAVLGSLANLTTLWRPTQNESEREKALLFYKYETFVSSVLYMVFAGVSLTLQKLFMTTDESTYHITTIALGLSVLCLAITQMYTRYFQDAIYPDDILMNKVIWKDILTTTNFGGTLEFQQSTKSKADIELGHLSIKSSLKRRDATPHSKFEETTDAAEYNHQVREMIIDILDETISAAVANATKTMSELNEMDNAHGIRNANGNHGPNEQDVNSIVVLEVDNNKCMNEGLQTENVKSKAATPSKNLLSILGVHLNHMARTIGKALRRTYQKALSSFKSGYLLVLATFIVSVLVITGIMIFYHQNANGKLKLYIEILH